MRSYTNPIPTDNSIEAANALLLIAWDAILPVDPIKIANRIGIAVNSIQSGKSTVAALHRENKPIIQYYNQNKQSINRYIIAHALCHHWMGHTTSGDSKFIDYEDNSENFNNNVHDQVEMKANNFAVALLIPTDVINYAIEKRNIASLIELSNIFDVSSVAMQFRLKQLGWI